MAFVSKQQRERRLVILISRVLIATCVVLSFLATVVSADFSSSRQTMMDCCVGKPGHEAGSCSSGLFASTVEQQHEAAADTETATHTTS